MRILVSGASGFTGRWMMDFLSRQQDVVPTGLVRSNPPVDDEISGTSWAAANLLERDHLSSILATIRPDAIIHLAGLTRGAAEDLYATNVTGTRNLLEAGLTANPDCRILVVSSSAVYGYAGDAPIPEEAPLKPSSDYGQSKVAQETLALGYAGDRQGAVSIARPFNLAGPGQPETFVCARIIDQVIKIERGEKYALDLWETISLRDFIDVRDVVRGYFALVSSQAFSADCSGRAFNLGSGNACAVAEIVGKIERITGTRYPINLPSTPTLVPVPIQRSDNARVAAVTGWRPRIPLEMTLADMLDAARKTADLPSSYQPP